MSLNIKDFLELEAEEGSENEEHDDCVKKISDSQEEEKVGNEDHNLEDLINDKDCLAGKKLAKDQKELRKKFIEDQMKKDKEEIKDVINENWRRRLKRKWGDVEKEYCNFTETEENTQGQNKNDFQSTQSDDLSKRKKIIRSLLVPDGGESQTTKNFGNINNIINNKKIVNLSKFKKLLSGDTEGEINQDNLLDDSDNTELLLKYEQEVKQKISENSSGFKRKFKERLRETTKIMESVIDLNKIPPKENKKPDVQKKNHFLPHKLSQSSQNSVLNAIKNDKYYPSNNTLISQKLNENLANQPNQKNFAVFNNKIKLDSEKKQKISAIFDKSERSQIIKIKDLNYQKEDKPFANKN
jgi:hypothetical protein